MDKRIEGVIDKAVRKQHKARPKFYVVTGSHIYGFPSNQGGDIDVRGFHLTDEREFFKIRRQTEQIIINQGETTDGFEFVKDIELVSYELRKFGRLLHKMNFNVVEWVFKGQEVVNGCPLEMEILRDILFENLPYDLPRHYLGMATMNYKRYLDHKKEAYRPTAKKHLYVLRGILGAMYVSQHHHVLADIRILSKAVLDKEDQEVVTDLIREKKASENVLVPNSLSVRANTLIKRLFKDIEIKTDTSCRDELEKAIDSWMLQLRGMDHDDL